MRISGNLNYLHLSFDQFFIYAALCLFLMTPEFAFAACEGDGRGSIGAISRWESETYTLVEKIIARDGPLTIFRGSMRQKAELETYHYFDGVYGFEYIGDVLYEMGDEVPTPFSSTAVKAQDKSFLEKIKTRLKDSSPELLKAMNEAWRGIPGTSYSYSDEKSNNRVIVHEPRQKDGFPHKGETTNVVVIELIHEDKSGGRSKLDLWFSPKYCQFVRYIETDADGKTMEAELTHFKAGGSDARKTHPETPEAAIGAMNAAMNMLDFDEMARLYHPKAHEQFRTIVESLVNRAPESDRADLLNLKGAPGDQMLKQFFQLIVRNSSLATAFLDGKIEVVKVDYKSDDMAEVFTKTTIPTSRGDVTEADISTLKRTPDGGWGAVLSEEKMQFYMGNSGAAK